MRRKVVTSLAATAIALGVGAFVAPIASAATELPGRTPVDGSASLCLNLNLGSMTIPLCI
ncbi:hypothetical protein FOS14_03200 [Skermania sp. ID1734]|uniref:hypothetical protein n=1 Tax=Skermania sp. ID1734 TaxID=2597516 RepID=UPI00117E58FB|nr:hypothetical protein [Skermania sp. ID1734]TSE01559.1 hypothetical protein FOS14_03200 [Skermania sp. ID1734]